MKVKALLFSVALVATIFTGCGQQAQPAAANKPVESTTQTNQAAKESLKTDAVATASVVGNIDAFQKAISKDGTWIIAITKDLTTDKELVVDGNFKDKKNPPVEHRKIALYSQDDKKNITARFTLTAPKITFNSPSGSLEHGIFKGDVYVAGKNFKLVDATIDGNLYFTTDEAQATFKMDDKSKITGKKEMKMAGM